MNEGCILEFMSNLSAQKDDVGLLETFKTAITYFLNHKPNGLVLKIDDFKSNVLSYPAAYGSYGTYRDYGRHGGYAHWPFQTTLE